MLLVNVDSFQDSNQTVSLNVRELPGNKALLALPPDLQVYILEVPALKPKHRDAAIRSQLRSHCPGDPDSAALDYAPGRIRRDGEHSCQRVAVYAMDSAVHAAYQAANKVIIPGTAILETGYRRIPARETRNAAALVLFLSSDRFEAARFEDGEITRHISAEITANTLPYSLIASLYSEAEIVDMPVLTIIQGEEDDPIPTVKLREMSAQDRFIALEDLIPAINVRKSAIFKPKRNTERRRTAMALTLLFLLAGNATLLGSLKALSAKAETQLEGLQKAWAEMTQYKPEAEKLTREIAEFKTADAAALAFRDTDPYVLLGEIHSRLSGAWIRSLVIEETRFSLEAEGTDSIAIVQGLGQSGFFYNVTLSQASPSAIQGERFTITGRIKHGNE
jgi:cell division protein FtsB